MTKPTKDNECVSGNESKDDSVWCPKCNVLMTWKEYREHAKKEFARTVELTECCNSDSEYDNKGKLRCSSCYRFTKTYKKVIEFIVPERRLLN